MTLRTQWGLDFTMGHRMAWKYTVPRFSVGVAGDWDRLPLIVAWELNHSRAQAPSDGLGLLFLLSLGLCALSWTITSFRYAEIGPALLNDNICLLICFRHCVIFET